jgi:cyclase
MLKKRIIPCLDIKDGRVVKGVNFENLIDAGNPISQAQFYYQEGADELCLLDITATNENRDTIFDVVKEVAKCCFIPLTVGGGIKKIEDFSQLMLCGADKISINSGALQNPTLITQAARKFGSQAVIIAIDAKKNLTSGNYEIYTHSGTRETGINALEWALKAQALGAGEVLLTSMDKDGTKSGYDTDLLKIISSNLKIPVIASGGVGELEHLKEGIEAGADAVLAASIFHFRKYSIKQAKDYLESQNIQCRN